MKKIRFNENSKFNYDYINDNNDIIEIKSKTTDGYLHLPEEINGRKLISIKFIENNIIDGELILDNIKSREKSIKSNEKKISNNWENFIDENDRKEYERIKSIAIKNMEKSKLMEEIERKKKEIEEMMKMINGD